MKKIILWSNILAMFFMIGCKEKSEISRLDMANLDTSVSPAADFYQYACGGWMKNNPLKPEYSRYGSFDQLGENNQKLVCNLIEDIAKTKHPQGSNSQKIADLYNMGMDSVTLNKQGLAPIAAQLSIVDEIKTKSDLVNVVAKFHKMGIPVFFQSYVHADMQDSKKNVLNIYQSGMGLPDKDYYVLQDENSKELRKEYVKYITKLFELNGVEEAKAKDYAEKVFGIEMRLAEYAYDKLELRDPYANYKMMSVADLQKHAPAIDWKTYFINIGLGNVDTLNNAQQRFVVEVSDIIKSSQLDNLKLYLTYNVLNNATEYLNDDMMNASFNFYGKMLSGQEEMKPRWKKVVNTIDGLIGEAVGQEYVAKYFPPEAKAKMLTLVSNLQAALGDRIDGATWMSDQTKAKAHDKLNSFRVKVGYPDKWRDYSKLDINKDSYWANVVCANEFEFEHMVDKINKPVDFDEWQMNPQMVNAYYSPTSNEICFPAAILQPPFFYLDGDDAINYGAIGVVIGHEMTHGFDDQGRQFDQYGNLNDWWTKEDADNFKTRSQVLVDYFNNIEVLDTLRANGEFTLGENIADNGGVQISYLALQKSQKDKKVEPIDGLTPAQRFFLSYSNIWAGNIRDKEIVRRTKEDPHSLGKWRVNGTLPHIDSFVEAFGVKEGDAMYLAPEKRASIW